MQPARKPSAGAQRDSRGEDALRGQGGQRSSREQRGRRGEITWLALSGLLLLLVAPGWALYRVAEVVGWGWVIGGWAGLSVVTYAVYAGDKRKAEAGEWRTPENTLHLLEFAGGWPAAFLAQRKLRHKISKTSYQVAFWLIVGVHQLAAADFLLDWKMSRKVLGREPVAEGAAKPVGSPRNFEERRTMPVVGKPVGTPRPAEVPRSGSKAKQRVPKKAKNKNEGYR